MRKDCAGCKVEFSALIVFNGRNREYRHHPESEYNEKSTIENRGEFSDMFYMKIKDFATSVLEHDLKKECKELDIPVKEIEVIDHRKGSIELIFTILFGVIGQVPWIVNMLQAMAQRRLQESLDREYRELFTTVTVRRHGGSSVPIEFVYVPPTRDGAFWYLLIANIALIAIILSLVFAAVVKVYYP